MRLTTSPVPRELIHPSKIHAFLNELKGLFFILSQLHILFYILLIIFYFSLSDLNFLANSYSCSKARIIETPLSEDILSVHSGSDTHSESLSNYLYTAVESY